MTVHRVASRKYIGDVEGTGARLWGGRWNKKGTPIIYTSESRSLAVLEFVVHTAINVAPTDLSIITLQIPERCEMKTVRVSSLPAGWRGYPAPDELADIGTEWANGNQSVGLKVPSVVVPQEYNVLLNPLHPEFRSIKVLKPEDLAVDPRLLQAR